MKRRTAVAAAIALLAFAAGCGGGEEGSGTGGSGGGVGVSASGDDAVAAANEACAAANRRIASLPVPDDELAVVEYLEATEATVDRLHAEVAGLDGSGGIAGYAAALATSVAVLNEMANAARSRNPDEVRELSKQLEELRVGKLAETAGLETCAEAPGSES